MFLDWFILCLIVILPILVAISGKRKTLRQPSNRFLYYAKDIIFSVVILAIFFLLKPSIYHPLDFSTIEKGFSVSEAVLSGIIPIFFITFLLSFTPWTGDYPKDITDAKELFGYPISYLPTTAKQYILFVCYIVVGVFFEELICRQFMFYSLNKTLHLNGDVLVIVSSLIFAIGHFYQGWKGILSSFVLGLLLGKIFLLKETLAYPIVLHLVLNLTIVVLAFRRMKDLKKINHNFQDNSLKD